MLIDICPLKRTLGNKIYSWLELHQCLWLLKWKKFYHQKFKTLWNQLMMDIL